MRKGNSTAEAGKKPKPARKRLAGGFWLPFPAILVGLAGSSVSLLAFLLLADGERDRMETDFEKRCDSATSQVRMHFASSYEVLAGMQNLFHFSEEVTRAEFSAASQEYTTRHPSIQALQWVQVVRDEDRAAYERGIREEGFEEFEMRVPDADRQPVRAPARESYLPITYVEPMADNERAFGFDLLGGPTVENLMAARDTGELQVSRGIRLIQEPADQFGVVFILPVYQTMQPPQTLEQRRESLTGYVQAVYRAGDMMHTAFAGLHEP